jgi:uncharacterized membrane protein YphA (DoxX/SURF4 family)
MKIAAILVRTLMGLLFIFGAVMFFLSPAPTDLSGNLKTYFDGLAASGYFFTLLKVTELVCGIAFVTGRFVPLAAVILAPIIVNILFVHIFLERSGLPIAIPLFLGNIFLGYYYRDKFAPILEMK